MDRESLLKTIIAALGTAATYLWGGWDAVLKALVTLAVIDYISGVAAAWVGRRLSSEAGARGIARKVGMFAVVAVCHIIDQTGGLGQPILRSVAAWWYVANEAISVIENFAEIGVPVPERITRALAVWRDSGETERGP